MSTMIVSSTDVRLAHFSPPGGRRGTSIVGLVSCPFGRGCKVDFRLIPSKRCLRLSATKSTSDDAHPPSTAPAPASPQSFLSFEEAGLVEMTNLGMHERFLARLTISSLNLLRVIAKQEGVHIEDLNAGRICDWFVKDKAKRGTDIDDAVLKWDDGPEF